MNRKSIAILMFAASVSSAYGEESVVLCSAPLEPDCVDPKWGQIEPDLTSGGNASSDAPSLAAKTADSGIHMAVRLMPVAFRNPSPAHTGDSTLKAVIDGTAMFRRETNALTAAIKRARFNREGKIVRGEERIAAAAEIARKAAPNYALTLYIKAPAKLSPDHAARLTNKITSINEVLAQPVTKGYPGKPQG